ncbi:MAG: phosphonoacetaldehyde dehydrogenase [Proteobacteria bacterium]|nr:phosphonoacetaldehyde dehydrogenase [Pseudomonadota bacterium]
MTGVRAETVGSLGSHSSVEAMRIAGERVHSDRVIEVRYPWTGEVIATVPRATVDQVRDAFAIAHRYVPVLSRHERNTILSRTAALVAERRDAIARTITLESGLCIRDSLYEVGRASDVLLFAAQQALLDDGQSFSCDVTAHGRSRRVHTMREPLLGVISAITPFNHPLNQVIHKVAPAVATNNRMVLKPSEKTPLSALLLADLLYEAGLPPQMLSVVTGDPAEIGDEMIDNPCAELITFTGGVAVGRRIAARAGYRRQVLELGGNDPLVVMDDADIGRAAALAASGSYRNSGQRCTAVKRIFVHERIAEPFTEAMVDITRNCRHGDPLDPEVDMGTVIDERAAMLFERRVADAVARGARLLHGNLRSGASYSPTLLDRVSGDMELVREETFGPVSPIMTFTNVDDAIAKVNSTAFGLSSGVCTNRLDDIMRFVRELQVGSVNIWEVPGYRLEVTPFGGIKDSGTGVKEGVQECCRSFTTVKTYSLPW